MTQSSNHSTPDRSAQSAKRDPFLALANEIERNPWWVDSAGIWELPPEENDGLLTPAAPTRKPRRQHKPRIRPPDGLRTPAEAAAKLGCSIKTLDGYVSTGALRYVALGHGKKRRRKMFADADLDEFVANQTRKDVACPSTASRVRHTGTPTSSGEVIAFTAAPKPRPGAKPRK